MNGRIAQGAGVDQVRIEVPVLGQRQRLVPVDRAVGTGVDDLLLPLCALGIDHHDAVAAFDDGIVVRGADTCRKRSDGGGLSNY